MSIPATVQYKWTPKDGQDAQQGKPVTPYTLHPSIVAGSRSLQGGAMISLPIGLGKAMLTVKRFDLAAGFGWDEVPAAAREAETLADLCKKLKATGNPRYAAAYYDIDKMSIAERNRVAMLLFDHWGNTEYRFAMITSGSFTWETINPGPAHDILAALKTSATSTWKTEPPGVVKRIKVVPVLLPVQTVIAAKPGVTAQKVVPPDPVLTLLDADVTEIRSLTQRIADLLKQAARAMEELLSVQRRVLALRVLAETCAGGSESSESAARRAGQARQLEKKVTDAVRKFELPEILSDRYIDPEIHRVLRKELGAADNVAKEIKRLAVALSDKLLNDPGAASRGGKFARAVIERKLHDTAGFREKRAKLVAALVDAAAILNETGVDADFLQKLREVLKLAPDTPVLKVSDVHDRCFLDSVFSFVGARWTPAGIAAGLNQIGALGTTLFGNLTGPPSLYIAYVQTRTWFTVYNALKQGSALTDIDAGKLLKETITEMEKGIHPTAAMRVKLQRAVDLRDAQMLKESQEQFLDELSAGRQATPRWKAGLLLVQLISILYGITVAAEDSKAGKPTEILVLDVLGLAGQVPLFFVGVADAAFTTEVGKRAVQFVAVRIPWTRLSQGLLNFDKAMTLVNKTGLGMGLLSSFIGLLTSAYQLGLAARENDRLGIVAASFGVAGSTTMMLGMAYALIGVPIPHVQAVGLALSSIGMALGIVKMVVDSAAPGPNVVAMKLLTLIERSPYFLVLVRDREMRDLFDKLKETCTYRVTVPETVLPFARNNMFVARTLQDAGFLKEHIAMVVETSGAPLMELPAFAGEEV